MGTKLWAPFPGLYLPLTQPQPTPTPLLWIESIPEPTLPIESGLTDTLVCVGIKKEGTPTGTLNTQRTT